MSLATSGGKAHCFVGYSVLLNLHFYMNKHLERKSWPSQYWFIWFLISFKNSTTNSKAKSFMVQRFKCHLHSPMLYIFSTPVEWLKCAHFCSSWIPCLTISIFMDNIQRKSLLKSHILRFCLLLIYKCNWSILRSFDQDSMTELPHLYWQYEYFFCNCVHPPATIPVIKFSFNCSSASSTTSCKYSCI